MKVYLGIGESLEISVLDNEGAECDPLWIIKHEERSERECRLVVREHTTRHESARDEYGSAIYSTPGDVVYESENFIADEEPTGGKLTRPATPDGMPTWIGQKKAD